MGCASSKRVETAVVADVYRPPPASIAVFDINTIEEPWLITASVDGGEVAAPEPEKKAAANVALPILDKLDSLEQAPQSWSEVSKALEDLKPSLHNPPPPVNSPPSPSPPPPPPPAPAPAAAPPARNQSFHTLEELEAKLNSDNKKPPNGPSPSPPPPLPLSTAASRPSRAVLPEGVRPVTQNSFLLRDKEEREKKAGSMPEDPTRRWRRNPLDGFAEICPPGGADGVVLYTTSLRGVRRTFDDCERARQLVEAHCLVTGAELDERDISLHGDYLKELRELVGEEAAVPRLFVKGRYVGGVNEVVEFNETARLRLILKLARDPAAAAAAAEGSGHGRRVCGGCGGARFVPCLDCNGSRKVVLDDGGSRKGAAAATVVCGRCNENGLVQCPLCH